MIKLNRWAREQQEAVRRTTTQQVEALAQQAAAQQAQEAAAQEATARQAAVQQAAVQQAAAQQTAARPKHWLTSSIKHSTVDSNGSSSTSVEGTTKCKAMQVVEANPRRKEAQCVSFVSNLSENTSGAGEWALCSMSAPERWCTWRVTQVCC